MSLSKNKRHINRFVTGAAGVLLAVALGTVIYSFSSQPGTESNDLSMRIVAFVVDRLSGLGLMPERSALTTHQLMDYNYILRKIAHGTLYCGLGLFSYLGIYGVLGRQRRSAWSGRWRGVIAFLLVLLLVFAFACFDEWRQNFTGRNGNLKDVGIDMIGGFVGVCVGSLMSLVRVRGKRKGASG